MRRETAIASALIMVLVAFHCLPGVDAQSQYIINDLSVLVTALDDRSARVVMDYNFTWLQAGTYVSNWNLVLDCPDAHGIRVESQGRVLGFTTHTEGDMTSLGIELGRSVAAGESMPLRIEYVTSSNIASIGPERRLSMSIWEDAPKDRVNLTVVVPESFRLISYRPSFIEVPAWGGGNVVTGTQETVPAGVNHRLDVSYSAGWARYNMTYEYTFTNAGSAAELGGEFELPIYAEAPFQTVTQLTVSPAPVASWYDDSGNNRARFRFDAIPAGGSVSIVVAYSIRVDLPPPLNGSSGGLPGGVPDPYLAYTVAEEYWEAGDPSIAGLAANLTAGEGSILGMAEAIYGFVVQNISYDYAKYNAVMSGIDVERYGAVKTLELGRGVCEDITDLYIALCRAAGIPAVEVVGFVYNQDGELTAANRHAWAEVYVPGHGWMEVDPTWGLFGALEGRHVGDRLFMNSSEPSYLVWSTRQSFIYETSSSATIQSESVYYEPSLSLTADHAGEAFTGVPFPVSLTISNLGNGTAFSTQGNITWSGNIETQNGSFFLERIWGYDYRSLGLVISPNQPGNATVWVHIEYAGEGGGRSEGDYSFSFIITEKPVYSIEGLAATLGLNVWVAMGGGIVAAVAVCLAVLGSRRKTDH